jgi:hypothetical protein
VKCGAFFAVRTKFLYIIYTSFGSKGLINYVYATADYIVKINNKIKINNEKSSMHFWLAETTVAQSTERNAWPDCIVRQSCLRMPTDKNGRIDEIGAR